MKKIKNKTNKIVTILIFFIIISNFPGCKSAVIIDKSIDIKIAITGNTNPDSPFRGFTEDLSEVIKQINEDNPIAVIHTGNIIHGGMDWMGISEDDIIRQYKAFKSEISKLNPIFHSVIGEKDLYNKSPDYYKKYITQKLNYSFNYGNIHFIIFNSLNVKFGSISKYQLRWLKKDLATHKQYSTVFLFTHLPFFHQNTSETSAISNIIHNILNKYPVKAVFSGSSEKYYKIEKGKIQYINLSCSGFTKETKLWHHNQYYLIDYVNGIINIIPKKIR